jgi:hypothetical protein
MNDLVRFLCREDHPVEVALKPQMSVEALRERIELGHIHIRFMDTKGTTELGVRLDRRLTELDKADFGRKEGHVKLVGDLTLDYVRVRCSADIELPALKGKGRLEVLSE